MKTQNSNSLKKKRLKSKKEKKKERKKGRNNVKSLRGKKVT